MENIQDNHTSFVNLTYTLSASPVFPYLKIEGFASEGMNWEDIEPSTMDKGADGQAYIVDKPVKYRNNFSLLANSPSRNILDALIEAGTVSFGKIPVKYNLVLTVANHTTGKKTVYSGGTFCRTNAGDSANRDNGQEPKPYSMEFASKVTLPL